MQRSIKAIAGRSGRLATAIAVGATLTLGLSGVAAAADPVTGKPRTDSLGVYGVVLNAKNNNKPVRVSRITLKLDADGKDVLAYCIDFRHDLATNKTYVESGWTESGVANLGKIQWILTHSYPARTVDEVVSAAGLTKPNGFTPEELANLAYVGTQAAIWSLSDADHFALQTFNLGAAEAPADKDLNDLATREKVDLGKLVKAYRFISALYNFLREQAREESEPAGLKIDPASATGNVGDKVGPFKVTSNVGEVQLTATGGALVDKAGKPVTKLNNGEQFWVNCQTETPVKVDALAKFNVPIGRVFRFKGAEEDRKQTIILAGFAGQELAANAAATCIAKPGLPVTGAPVAGTVAAGLVLLTAGAGLFMVRRRRIRFTA